MTSGRYSVALVPGILLLGLAGAAGAAPKLYSGTLTVHAFGITSSAYVGGTASPVHLTSKNYYALPIGRYCNTIYTGLGPLRMTLGMGDPDDPCASTPTFHTGAPLTGSGTLSSASMKTPMMKSGAPSTFDPPALLLGAKNVGELRRTIMGSFRYAPPYYPLSITTAAVYNGSGALYPGAGPGSLLFYSVGSLYKASARITAGSKQFGGTLRVLGEMKSYGYYGGANLIIGYWNWLWSVIGGFPSNVASYSGQVYNTIGVTLTNLVQAVGFPWTTGTASVYVRVGSFWPSVFARNGYDNRDVYGNGRLQLVTPRLTWWQTSNGIVWRLTGSIAIMTLQVPEPSSWALTAAGTALLAVLRRVRSQR